MRSLLSVASECMAVPNTWACLIMILSHTWIQRMLSYLSYHFHPCFLDSLLLRSGKEKERVFISFNSLTQWVFTMSIQRTRNEGINANSLVVFHHCFNQVQSEKHNPPGHFFFLFKFIFILFFSLIWFLLEYSCFTMLY